MLGWKRKFARQILHQDFFPYVEYSVKKNGNSYKSYGIRSSLGNEVLVKVFYLYLLTYLLILCHNKNTYLYSLLYQIDYHQHSTFHRRNYKFNF